MTKYTTRFFFLTMLVFVLYSCKSDDDSYTPIQIGVTADFGQVAQNATIELDVLANDTNVPTTGSFSVASAQSGTVEVLNNDTPGDPSDDTISYTADVSFLGDDTFQYTICNEGSVGCVTATVTVTVVPRSPVNFDIEQVPYPNLSDYNFFEGDMANQIPVEGVIPYAPISKLFTDYAKKKRFIWMPSGVKASYVGDHDILNMPTGTILIKTFYYDNVQPANNTRIIESRLMIKKDSGWIFANYVWNTEQTEASFDLEGSFTEVNWIQDGASRTVNYRIPPESQCFTCHKGNAVNIPIGLKPQNLNANYAYDEGSKNQLQKLMEEGYLETNVPLPSDITTVIDWTDTSSPLKDRVRSYIDINCAHCHSDGGHCDYRPMRFAFADNDSEVNMGVCVDPNTALPPYTKIIEPGDAGLSVLYFRFGTEEEQYRMPLLGRSLVHQEALDMVEEWINSLTTVCD